MENLTSKIKEILDTPDSQIDIDSAATILLKINRNQILHQNIIRKNNVAKLRYELQKIYDFRSKEDAIAETKVLEEKVKPILTETLPVVEKIETSESKGLRADHDQLPDEIKAKFVENLNIFPRMRKLHEQLKLMADAKPCDRFPFLQELVDLDKQLRENWDAYDSFVSPAPGTAQTTLPTIETTMDPKAISAARKYLSDNKQKLTELKALEDQSKYLALLTKMQNRLSMLIAVNAGVSEEYLNELKDLGLTNA